MRLLQTFLGVATLAIFCGAAGAQESPAPKPADAGAQTTSPVTAALTLKRTIELALQNTKEIQIAKIQASVADHARTTVGTRRSVRAFVARRQYASCSEDSRGARVDRSRYPARPRAREARMRV